MPIRAIESASRRDFLKGLVSAGALVLSVGLLPEDLRAGSRVHTTLAANAAFQPDVYLAIDTDGTVFIVEHRSEMGQGVRTSLPRIIADELDADWQRVRIEQAIGDAKYGDQDTEASRSTLEFYDLFREAGATARLLLRQAAAQQWNVPLSECSTELHSVLHKTSNRRLAYGELASAAAKLPLPKKEDLSLKPRDAWRYIGKPAKTYDAAGICTGRAIYGQDTRTEGMLYAAVQHPPVFGGTLKSFDDTNARRVPGVRQTATIDPPKPPVGFQALGGVAVLADSTWAAMQGRKKLKIQWDDGPNINFTSSAYKKQLQEAARQPGKLIRNNGDIAAEFAKSSRILEADYYTPLLVHAPMEPPAALADFRDGKVTLWASTQNPQLVQDMVSQALGLKKEDITCHVALLGGGFGRKSFPDYAVEAAVLSKKAGRPIKVVWSREDDIQNDSYHPTAAVYLKAALDNSGKPTAWLHRSVFPPIASTFTAGAVYPDPWELACGSTDVPFAIPNLRVENGPVPAHLRFGWFRSVCNAFHGFAIQSFADELAHAAGRDPLEYLLALLGPDRIIDRKDLPADYPSKGEFYAKFPVDIARFRRVVELAAEKSGWGKEKLGDGSGMGLAVHRTGLTCVASVVRAEIDARGHAKIRRVDTAVDVGTVVNPEGIRKQYEGAAVYATSLALYGEITATNGVINQSNFHDYPMARITDAPAETHVHIVPSEAHPIGAGEGGVPPIAPALCNAIFAATGRRIRELPLSKSKLA
jgi:isoquinoline 1-oxidoreductase subunit beta